MLKKTQYSALYKEWEAKSKSCRELSTLNDDWQRKYRAAVEENCENDKLLKGNLSDKDRSIAALQERFKNGTIILLVH